MAHVLDAIIQLRDNFSGTLERVTKQAINSHKEMKKLGKEVESMGKSMESAGSGLTKAITLPIIGIGAAAIKLGMDFEATMSEVKALSGANAEEMRRLETAARDMGAKTSKSATEAGEALKYMSLAGWDVETSIKSLEPVLRLSEAGNLDLGRASDLVTDSMSALGLKSDELRGYLDMVAQTSRKSNTDIDMLSEAFIVAGGTFKNLKVPLDEASTMLGMLAIRGIKGSEAGNSLNSIMINLTSGAGQAGEAMKQLGLSAFDNEGNFKGMGKVLNELRDKLSGMTEEQQNSYLAMIGGKTQINTLNALISGMGEEYEGLRKDVQGANGALMDMAIEMQDNNKGSITELVSALEELGLKIYDILKPKIAIAVEWLQKLTAKLNSMSPQAQETAVKIAMIAAAIGPALFVFGKITTIVGGGMLKFSAFAKQVKTTGSIMKAIANPATLIVIKIAAIIAIVAAVIAVFVKLYQTNETVRNKIDMVWSTIKSIISSAVGAVKALWETHGNDITSIAQKAWELFGDIVSIALNLVMGAITVFSGIFSVVWPIIASSVSTAVGIITTVLNGIITIAQGIIDFIVGVFTGNWELAWQGVVGIVKGIFGTIVGIVENAINGLIGHINGFIKAANKIQIPDDIPGIGGMGVNIPLIPQLAKGTDYWKGGMVQVHERGGEIIDLDSGSRVYPHDKSVQMAREDGRKEATSGKQIVITIPKLADEIVVRKEDDIDTITTKVAKKIVKELEEADMNMA